MMLEAGEYAERGLESAFVTLTYAPEYLPEGQNVVKEHLGRFIEDLRVLVRPRRIRYYAVGEYGDQSWRPHYHLIVFGLSPTEGEKVQQAWKKGLVHMGTAEPSTMRYVSGYVVKKMTKAEDPRLAGRTPEFACMSLKPGLGYGIVERMTRSYTTEQGLSVLEKHWPSNQVRLNGQVYPLGRYLHQKLLAELGIDRGMKAEYHAHAFEQAYESQLGEPLKRRQEIWKARIQQQEGKFKIHRQHRRL